MRPSILSIAAAVLAAFALPGPVRAQDESVPTTGDVAAVVAAAGDSESLYRVAALARYLSEWRQTGSRPDPGMMQEDFEWLNHIASRYGMTGERSPVLDPAAWRALLELGPLGAQPDLLVSPLGPDLDTYLRAVFDRSGERLAAAMLPELLWTVAPRATLLWSEWLEQAEAPREWMADWAGNDPGDARSTDLFADIGRNMELLASSVTGEGPPYRERLFRTRYLLLAAMPGLDEPDRRAATSFLRLTGMVDGLHEGRYFAFVEGLLALTAEFLLTPGSQANTRPMEWLGTNLPDISARYAREFSRVDPQLNSALAAAYDLVMGARRMSGEAPDTEPFHRQLGNSAAQMALLIPDLDYYFGLPVRDPIAGGVDACTGIVAMRDEDGSPSMTRELYDDCQQSIVELADREARNAALAGDPDGPFGDEELRRELTITSGQRINYGIGYLHDRYETGCGRPGQPLPNPLEWSALATLLAWFAEQSPVFFKTPGNEERLNRMREIGGELTRVLSEQVDCFAGTGDGVNDPVSRSLAEYREALVALGSGINGAIFDFRRQLLAEGADIVLQRDASQATAYRPDDLVIGPCDPERTCEMADGLSSTRALLGLFPDPYLVADQAGLGSVEICYDRMSWVDRRSEQVRADDTNVANYFGRLEFELIGRYRSGDSVDDLFGFRFRSPDEYHYLFAAASDEVLEDACPMEWIGQRIVTPLRGDRGGIVPNRLTYLSAPRMLPSRLLSANWARGAEWRDWFITGIGVERLELDPPEDITGALNLHLQSLHRQEQEVVYRSLLQPAYRGGVAGIESLYEEAVKVGTIKALIRHQLMVFYPLSLVGSDALRSAVAGHGGLLDSAMLLKWRNDDTPVNSLNRLGLQRLAQVEAEWARQPEAIRRAGSPMVSVAHAMMRLDEVNRRYFSEAESTTAAK